MTTTTIHSVTLTAAMLREALEYANPDYPDDKEQEETEVVIEWMPERTSVENEIMPAGYYLYYSDYPEEGVIGPLGAEPVTAISMTALDLITHLHRQREFSLRTFGPGRRTQGVLDHIRKELAEIEADPTDVEEWIDVVLLALDGAWRAGFEPEAIAAALEAKQTKNEGRTWPDWRTAEPGNAIEHVRAEPPEHHPV